MAFKRLVQKMNDWVAVKATLSMGTMWCVYAFTLLALAPTAWPASSVFIQYVSSAVIQLVALPLIMVGQSVMNRSSERRAKQDHETLLKILHELRVHAEAANKENPKKKNCR